MHNTALALAILACVGHGWRVQTTSKQSQGSRIAESQMPTSATDGDVSAESLLDPARATAFAKLLLASNPAAAFNPSGLGARFPAGSSNSATSPRVPATAMSASRRQMLALGSAALLTMAGISAPALADDVGTTAVSQKQCLKTCIKDCNGGVPGNEEYCSSRCTEFCSGDAATSKAPLDDTLDGYKGEAPVRTAEDKDCSKFKTPKAREYCESQNEKLAISSGRDVGIFGETLPYSKDIDNLFAAIYGAKRAGRDDVSKANVEGYVGDIKEAFKKVAKGEGK